MTEPDTRSMRLSFGPTTGVFAGVTGMIIVALVFVLIAWQDHSIVGLRILLATLAVGVVVWCYQLRPRVILDATELELRNAFVDHVIPYTAVDDVVVRTITRVYVDGKKYGGLGVGHPARRLMRQSTGSVAEEPRTSLNGKLLPTALPDWVQDQILERVTVARRGEEPSGSVSTRAAGPELVLLAMFVVGFVVSLFF